jgi:periplasmic protein TonB
MHRRPLHGELEKIAMEVVPKQMNRRNILCSFAVLLTALLVFPSFAMTTPMVAQDGSGAQPAQKSTDAEPNGVYKIGGDVSAPVLIYAVEPKMSEEARHAHVKGDVWVKIYVDKNGNPTHVHVIRGIGPNGVGLDLDESAIETVKQYKFKPAMKSGKPVMVELNIEVNFQAN